MIPKIIHFCWFGGKELPTLAKDCIKSWKKYCPDYKIIEWNESNFDLKSNDYCYEAYQAKKWAFITDFVRLKVLKEQGGIYMDTDVEVIKPFDDELLSRRAFSGFENSNQIPTGIMASEPGMPIIEYLLEYYDNCHFINENGIANIATNVITITRMMTEKGLQLDNSLQTIEGFTFYPIDYFCPKDYSSGRISLTNNTYTIHHFGGSWKGKNEVRIHKIKQLIKKTFGIQSVIRK